MMKPSRSRSKGRLAVSGSSLRVDSARIAANPPTPIGVIADFGAAGDHHVGAAAADDLERVADGVRRGGAGGAGRRVRSLGAEADGHLAGGQVDDRCGNEEGRDAARPALEQRLVLALDGAEPADARGDEHPDARGDLRRDLQPGVVDRELRRGDGELDEDVHLLDVFLLDELQRIELLHLTGDTRREL